MFERRSRFHPAPDLTGYTHVRDLAPTELLTVSIHLRADPALEDERQVVLAGQLLPLAERTTEPVSCDELHRLYAAAVSDRALLAQFLDAHNLRVTPNDAYPTTILRVIGRAADHARAFGITPAVYTHPDHGEALVHAEPVTLPDELHAPVLGVLGLDRRRTQQFAVGPPQQLPPGLLPNDVAAFYNSPSGDGANQVIAMTEVNGGYTLGDFANYFSLMGEPVPVVTYTGVDNTPNNPQVNDATAETYVDICIAGGVAPGALLEVFNGPTGSGFADTVSAAIFSNPTPHILFICEGNTESDPTTQTYKAAMDQALQAGVSAGVTVLAASGDNATLLYPASSPFVCGVGGTYAPASGNTPVAPETTWNNQTLAGATGGGYSSFFPKPVWQTGNANPQRGVPDVSAIASSTNGWAVVAPRSNGGITSGGGGTSAACPVWAGILARVGAQIGRRLGFINATLYQSPSAFTDITTGGNGLFNAGPGWDPCTGMGTPRGTILAAVLSTGGGSSGPIVTAVSPNIGPAGTLVTITGQNLLPLGGIIFGSVPAQAITAISPTEVQAVAPPGGGTVDIRVQTPSGISPVSPGDVYAYPGGSVGPVITSISPSTGPNSGGTFVTVFGTGFTAATLEGVLFGTTPSPLVPILTPTYIQAESPPGTGTVDIRVQMSSGLSPITAADQFSYGGAQGSGPTVTGVSPNTGPAAGGTRVTISGHGFATPAFGQTLFGGVPANTLSVTDTTIVAIAPAHTAGTVDVQVTNALSQISAIVPADRFTYALPVPQVTSVSPPSGPVTGGFPLTLFGSGFTGATVVTLGPDAATASFIVVSDNQIVIPSAPGTLTAQGADVQVIGPGGTSPVNPGDEFVYTPIVTDLRPPSGPTSGETLGFIDGIGFSPAIDIFYGSQEAPPAVIVSPAQLVSSAPPVDAPQTVEVSGCLSPFGVTYCGPGAPYTYNQIATVEAITPDFDFIGGGQQITISGAGFVGAGLQTLEVLFGSTPALDILSISDTEIVCIDPPHIAGPSSVTVIVNGIPAIPTLPFTYNWLATGGPVPPLLACGQSRIYDAAIVGSVGTEGPSSVLSLCDRVPAGNYGIVRGPQQSLGIVASQAAAWGLRGVAFLVGDDVSLSDYRQPFGPDMAVPQIEYRPSTGHGAAPWQVNQAQLIADSYAGPPAAGALPGSITLHQGGATSHAGIGALAAARQVGTVVRTGTGIVPAPDHSTAMLPLAGPAGGVMVYGNGPLLKGVGVYLINTGSPSYSVADFASYIQTLVTQGQLTAPDGSIYPAAVWLGSTQRFDLSESPTNQDVINYVSNLSTNGQVPASSYQQTLYVIALDSAQSTSAFQSQTGVAGCSYHQVLSQVGNTGAYIAVVFDFAGVALCQGDWPQLSPYQQTQVAASHEIGEARTDPSPITGWTEGSNSTENGDLCTSTVAPFSGAWYTETFYVNGVGCVPITFGAPPPPPAPVVLAGSLVGPRTVAPGQTATYTVQANTTNGFVSAVLFSDTGETALGTTFSHTFPSISGDVVIMSLRVVDNGTGVADFFTVVVVVSALAAIVSGPSSVQANVPAAFTVTVTGNNPGDQFSVAWDFGDGSTQTTSGLTASHTYSTTGTKTVSVTVTDSATGLPASASTTILVTPGGTPPSAPQNVSAVAGNQQATVFWEAPVSSGSSPITLYTITASPGGQSISASPSATAAVVPGLINGTAYTFTVRASNTFGPGLLSAPSNAVTPTAAPPISVQAQVNPTAPTTDEAVQFTAAVTGSDNFTATWTFGDGSGSAVGAVVAHSFSNPGTYTVVVEVADNATGAQATASVAITVSGLPALTLNISGPQNVSIGQAAAWSALLAGAVGPTTYAWAWSDGPTGSDATISRSFSAPATLTLSLQVTDAGRTVTASLAVTVSAAPPPQTLSVTISGPTLLDLNQPGTFDAIVANSDNFTGMWDFGDGTQAIGQAVGHAWQAPGIYTILVTVQDAATLQTGTAALAVTVGLGSGGPGRPLAVGGLFVLRGTSLINPVGAGTQIAAVANVLALDYVMVDVDDPIWQTAGAGDKLLALLQSAQRHFLRPANAPPALAGISQHRPVFVIFPPAPVPPFGLQAGDGCVEALVNGYNGPKTIAAPHVPASSPSVQPAWLWAQGIDAAGTGMNHAEIVIDLRGGGGNAAALAQQAVQGVSVQYPGGRGSFNGLVSGVIFYDDWSALAAQGGPHGPAPQGYWTYGGVPAVQGAIVPSVTPDAPPLAQTNRDWAVLDAAGNRIHLTIGFENWRTGHVQAYNSPAWVEVIDPQCPGTLPVLNNWLQMNGAPLATQGGGAVFAGNIPGHQLNFSGVPVSGDDGVYPILITVQRAQNNPDLQTSFSYVLDVVDPSRVEQVGPAVASTGVPIGMPDIGATSDRGSNLHAPGPPPLSVARLPGDWSTPNAWCPGTIFSPLPPMPLPPKVVGTPYRQTNACGFSYLPDFVSATATGCAGSTTPPPFYCGDTAMTAAYTAFVFAVSASLSGLDPNYTSSGGSSGGGGVFPQALLYALAQSESGGVGYTCQPGCNCTSGIGFFGVSGSGPLGNCIYTTSQDPNNPITPPLALYHNWADAVNGLATALQQAEASAWAYIISHPGDVNGDALALVNAGYFQSGGMNNPANVQWYNSITSIAASMPPNWQPPSTNFAGLAPQVPLYGLFALGTQQGIAAGYSFQNPLDPAHDLSKTAVSLGLAAPVLQAVWAQTIQTDCLGNSPDDAVRHAYLLFTGAVGNYSGTATGPGCNQTPGPNPPPALNTVAQTAACFRPTYAQHYGSPSTPANTGPSPYIGNTCGLVAAALQAGFRAGRGSYGTTGDDELTTIIAISLAEDHGSDPFTIGPLTPGCGGIPDSGVGVLQIFSTCHGPTLTEKAQGYSLGTANACMSDPNCSFAVMYQDMGCASGFCNFGYNGTATTDCGTLSIGTFASYYGGLCNLSCQNAYCNFLPQARAAIASCPNGTPVIYNPPPAVTQNPPQPGLPGTIGGIILGCPLGTTDPRNPCPSCCITQTCQGHASTEGLMALDIGSYQGGAVLYGTTIVATCPGTIITRAFDTVSGYGNQVIIQCDDQPAFGGVPVFTRFAHMTNESITMPTLPAQGEHVIATQTIGYADGTGHVEPPGIAGSHLHYEINVGGLGAAFTVCPMSEAVTMPDGTFHPAGPDYLGPCYRICS